MAQATDFTLPEPSREQIDALPGATLLEFGTAWCGWCQGAQPHIATALAPHPGLRHLKIEDGPGRPLGRAFRVKLWPTLVLLQDGRELARVVRPANAEVIGEMLGSVPS